MHSNKDPGSSIPRDLNQNPGLNTSATESWLDLNTLTQAQQLQGERRASMRFASLILAHITAESGQCVPPRSDLQRVTNLVNNLAGFAATAGHAGCLAIEDPIGSDVYPYVGTGTLYIRSEVGDDKPVEDFDSVGFDMYKMLNKHNLELPEGVYIKLFYIKPSP